MLATGGCCAAGDRFDLAANPPFPMHGIKSMPRTSLLQLFRILETQQPDWDYVRAKLAHEAVPESVVVMVAEWARASERQQNGAPTVSAAGQRSSEQEVGQAVRVEIVPEAAPVGASQAAQCAPQPPPVSPPFPAVQLPLLGAAFLQVQMDEAGPGADEHDVATRVPKVRFGSIDKGTQIKGISANGPLVQLEHAGLEVHPADLFEAIRQQGGPAAVRHP